MEETHHNILALLDTLDQQLQHRQPDHTQKVCSLGSGEVGAVLFYTHYFLLTGQQRHAEAANNILCACLEHAAASHVKDTFCDGIAGLGWVTQYLINKNVLNAHDDILDEYDHYLLQSGLKFLSRGNYDFLHGGLGACIYFLERKGKEMELEKLFRLLIASSHTDATGQYWLENALPFYTNDPRPRVNLGLAHGMASIVFFLSKLIEKDVAVKEARGVLWRVLNKIYLYLDDTMCTGSFFPSRLYLDSDLGDTKSRLAWCYGDLGMSLSLLNAARALGDRHLESGVLQMARMTAARRLPSDTLLKDGGICHGIAGVTHLYNRLFLLTSDDVFEEAAHHWVGQLLTHIESTGGLLNFFEFNSLSGKYTRSCGFLTGNIGAALVLASYCNKQVPPDWDRALLLN